MADDLTEYVVYGWLKGYPLDPQLIYIGEGEHEEEKYYIIRSAQVDGIPGVLDDYGAYQPGEHRRLPPLLFKGRRRAMRGVIAFWDMLKRDRLPAKDDEGDYLWMANAPLDDYYIDFCTLEEFWRMVLDGTSKEGFQALMDEGIFTAAELLELNQEALSSSEVLSGHELVNLKMQQMGL